MRNLVIVCLSALFSTSVQAGMGRIQDCVNMDNFEQDASCIEQVISSNINFSNSVDKIQERAVRQDDRLMSVLKFYPEQMLIEVTAFIEDEDSWSQVDGFDSNTY